MTSETTRDAVPEDWPQGMRPGRTACSFSADLDSQKEYERREELHTKAAFEKGDLSSRLAESSGPTKPGALPPVPSVPPVPPGAARWRTMPSTAEVSGWCRPTF
jgi:hypothetical protein